MKNIVLSFGGSVLLSKDVDVEFLHRLADLLRKLSSRYKIYVIVGGGSVARTYINLGRTLKFDEDVLDSFGIEITRVNAKMFACLLEISNQEIPSTTDEAKRIRKPIVVMGGTTPGHSTDMVSAELAEKIMAVRFVNATNVDGIYDKDPHKYPDAQQIREISVQDLIQKYGTTWDSAGKNVVIDGPALAIIKRAKIPTSIVNGKRLDQLENALTGQSFSGTTITL